MGAKLRSNHKIVEEKIVSQLVSQCDDIECEFEEKLVCMIEISVASPPSYNYAVKMLKPVSLLPPLLSSALGQWPVGASLDAHFGIGLRNCNSQGVGRGSGATTGNTDRT